MTHDVFPTKLKINLQKVRRDYMILGARVASRDAGNMQPNKTEKDLNCICMESSTSNSSTRSQVIQSSKKKPRLQKLLHKLISFPNSSSAV